MASTVDSPARDAALDRGDVWLRAFHAGERRCLEQCYRDHLDAVDRVVATVVTTGADRETLVHEVFFRLLSEETLRQKFRGGSFSAWLRVVARNQAIDFVRRRRLEARIPDEATAAADPAPGSPSLEQKIDVQLTLERFREQVLPRKWDRVFTARFLDQQDQPAAARALGMRRTTLAYQEYRIRKLLRRFVLRGESR
jgi:RNA polymerase sigma-70 factor (ECF subfamily)